MDAGGQAGASSRIENYLGFPSGVSGSELTRRAVAQAQRLGAEFLTPIQVTGVSVESGYKRVLLQDGREIVARAVVAATGMTYREHTANGIAELAGAGIYYGAAVTEAQLVPRAPHHDRGRRQLGGTERGVSFALRRRSASDHSPQQSQRNHVALSD